MANKASHRCLLGRVNVTLRNHYMALRSFISKPIAAWAVYQQRQWRKNPAVTQRKIFRQLITRALHTLFGRTHHFDAIHSYADFKAHVPVRDYEALSPYIHKIRAGMGNVLWPGKPLYLAKTSGTTSGSKYIPITPDSMPYHIAGARDALLHYIYETGNTRFLNKKMLFLSGSPQLEDTETVPMGRLSGIVNHHVPAYLRRHHLPSYEVNRMADWETKVDAIVEETLPVKLGCIGGIPPWVQMYLDKVQQRTGKAVTEHFPDLALLVHGGVNFGPYRTKLFNTLGKPIDTVETYPASEGFIAFQDSTQVEGLLLLLDSGIFFEFIPTEEFFQERPTRLCIEEVSLGIDYAIVLSTNAGLWAYTLGDTVKFVSKDPYRIIVTGRIKHFISAFGEHVIAEEVEKAMQQTLAKHPEAVLTEFTVAPRVSSEPGVSSYHEWLIEFAELPQDVSAFAQDLDRELCQSNAYYHDLTSGKVLHPLQITQLAKGSFKQYMQATNALGGQNKVVHLSNERGMADVLLSYQK